MSIDILRATTLKYGAIHSAEPKQMWVFSLDYLTYNLTYSSISKYGTVITNKDKKKYKGSDNPI